MPEPVRTQVSEHMEVSVTASTHGRLPDRARNRHGHLLRCPCLTDPQHLAGGWPASGPGRLLLALGL